MKYFTKNTKEIVGSSILLGVGGATLGAFEGLPGVPSDLSSKTIGTSANMMGAVIPATMGFGIIKSMKKWK